MNLWLKAITISLALYTVLADGDDCAKLLDGFATCVIKIKQDKDLGTLISKKIDIMKDCGATDANVKCFKTTHECLAKVEDKVADSSERKDSMKDAAACWDKEPKNPLAGVAELFQGLSEFIGSHPPPHPPGGPPPGPWVHGDGPPPPPGAVNAPPPPPGGPPPGPWVHGDEPPPPPGAVNAPPPPPGSPPLPPPGMMPPMPGMMPGHHGGPFPLPEDCDPTKVDKSVVNCTISKLMDGKDLMSIISTLKDKLKDCKKTVPPECKPHGPGLFGCLLDAYKPTLKMAVTTYKDCMDKGGYKIPDDDGPHPMPLDSGPKGGDSSSNSSSHDLLFF